MRLSEKMRAAVDGNPDDVFVRDWLELCAEVAQLEEQLKMERIKRDIAKGYLRPIDIDRYERDVIATPEYKALKGGE